MGLVGRGRGHKHICIAKHVILSKCDDQLASVHVIKSEGILLKYDKPTKTGMFYAYIHFSQISAEGIKKNWGKRPALAKLLLIRNGEVYSS